MGTAHKEHQDSAVPRSFSAMLYCSLSKYHLLTNSLSLQTSCCSLHFSASVYTEWHYIIAWMLTSICETGLNHLTANLTKMEIERRMMKNEWGEEQYSKTTPEPEQTVLCLLQETTVNYDYYWTTFKISKHLLNNNNHIMACKQGKYIYCRSFMPWMDCSVI